MEAIKTIKKSSKLKGDKRKNSVFMENICSMEHYKNEDGEIKQVLRDINFLAKMGETWVVTGDSLFDIKLLLEIMANTKPYQTGKCILVETGMMRKKRIILNHTFYIGNINMPFNNMRVLEYLMFVSGKKEKKEDAIKRQTKLLDLLVELGLGYISLSEISRLQPEEKCMVTLLVSALSESELIVFNIPMLEFNERQSNAVKNISNYIGSVGKTLIFSTMDKNLAQEIGKNILVLNNGIVAYEGGKRDFVREFDKVIFRITSENNEKLIKYLNKSYDMFEYKLVEGYIDVFKHKRIENYENKVYEALMKSKINILKIEKNILNVKNAYRELVSSYDI